MTANTADLPLKKKKKKKFPGGHVAPTLLVILKSPDMEQYAD